MEEAVLPECSPPASLQESHSGQARRAGSQSLVNIRAFGSHGDFVEHLELQVCFIPSGTQNSFTGRGDSYLMCISFSAFKNDNISRNHILAGQK